MFSFRTSPASDRRRNSSKFAFRPGAEACEPRLLLSGSTADVLTYHNDNDRTGQDLDETTLTPANVNASSFGKLFTDPVDGYVYAEPLTTANLAIPGQGTHNVVFVATEHDSVYAFDADHPGAPLWHVSFINPAAGVTTVPATADYQLDMYPEVGITGTPVIDPATGTLYVIAETQVAGPSGTHDVDTLHALDITTGAEKFGGPQVIATSVRGKGIGQGPKGVVAFNADDELQRPALLLSKGVVYSAYGSLGDYGPFHGWIIGNSASTLKTVATFNDTPNGSEGGIWMSGGGLAADAAGSIYAQTGNGTFNPKSGGYGDSIIKLNHSLKVTDYFTPSNQAALSAQDKDLGSGGPILAPDQPGKVPHVLVGGGKDGTLFTVNRDKLGHYTTKPNPSVSVMASGHPVFSVPAYYNGSVYITSVGDVLKQYSLANGALGGPVSQTTASFGYPGATPAVSADGDTSGIVWALQNSGTRGAPGQSVLHAYDATNVGRELYNSNQAGTRDQSGLAVKFTVPTVSNGKVYVGTQGGLTAYGLLD